MSPLPFAIAGGAFAAILGALWHLPGGDHVKEGFAISLGVMAGIDMGATVIATLRRERLLENIGVFIVLMALIGAGSYVHPLWLAAGFFLHGGWALFQNESDVPRWYRWFAFGFGIVSGAAILWLFAA